MAYTLRPAVRSDTVRVATMLRTSLENGVDGKFGIDSTKLLNAVTQNIHSASCFSYVLLSEGVAIGCFMAALEPHAYARGYIVRDLGCYIDPAHRGHGNFELLFTAYLEWAKSKPDVLMTTFTIGQIGATTPYLRAVLKTHGFTQGDEGYYRI